MAIGLEEEVVFATVAAHRIYRKLEGSDDIRHIPATNQHVIAYRRPRVPEALGEHLIEVQVLHRKTLNGRNHNNLFAAPLILRLSTKVINDIPPPYHIIILTSAFFLVG